MPKEKTETFNWRKIKIYGETDDNASVETGSERVWIKYKDLKQAVFFDDGAYSITFAWLVLFWV